jgi:hypothetical protein
MLKRPNPDDDADGQSIAVPTDYPQQQQQQQPDVDMQQQQKRVKEGRVHRHHGRDKGDTLAPKHKKQRTEKGEAGASPAATAAPGSIKKKKKKPESIDGSRGDSAAPKSTMAAKDSLGKAVSDAAASAATRVAPASAPLAAESAPEPVRSAAAVEPKSTEKVAPAMASEDLVPPNRRAESDLQPLHGAADRSSGIDRDGCEFAPVRRDTIRSDYDDVISSLPRSGLHDSASRDLFEGIFDDFCDDGGGRFYASSGIRRGEDAEMAALPMQSGNRSEDTIGSIVSVTPAPGQDARQQQHQHQQDMMIDADQQYAMVRFSMSVPSGVRWVAPPAIETGTLDQAHILGMGDLEQLMLKWIIRPALFPAAYCNARAMCPCHIAVAGRSGSGKRTAVSLLCKTYHVAFAAIDSYVKDDIARCVRSAIERAPCVVMFDDFPALARRPGFLDEFSFEIRSGAARSSGVWFVFSAETIEPFLPNCANPDDSVFDLVRDRVAVAERINNRALARLIEEVFLPRDGKTTIRPPLIESQRLQLASACNDASPGDAFYFAAKVVFSAVGKLSPTDITARFGDSARQRKDEIDPRSVPAATYTVSWSKDIDPLLKEVANVRQELTAVRKSICGIPASFLSRGQKPMPGCGPTSISLSCSPPPSMPEFI